MRFSIVFLILLTLVTGRAYADEFYTLVGYRCDQKRDRLTVSYQGAYNGKGEDLIKNKKNDQWDPWKLVVMRDDSHIGSTKEIRKICNLSDGAYDVSIGIIPGNWNIQGKCGAFITAWTEIRRESRSFGKISFEDPDCFSERDVITTVTIRPGNKPSTSSVSHSEFYE